MPEISQETYNKLRYRFGDGDADTLVNQLLDRCTDLYKVVVENPELLAVSGTLYRANPSYGDSQANNS